MTYSLKHKLRNIIYDACLLIWLACYFLPARYFFEGTKYFWLYWALQMGIFFAALFILPQIKKDIKLKPEDYNKPLEKEVDCSNAIDSFNISVTSIYIIIVVLSNSPHYMSYPNYILLVFALVSLLIIAPVHSKNKYIIQDDTLIVEEYNYKWQVSSLRIPIDTIERVYIKGIAMPMPAVVLVIDGVERELRCNMHYLELATELTRRINKTR